MMVTFDCGIPEGAKGTNALGSRLGGRIMVPSSPQRTHPCATPGFSPKGVLRVGRAAL